MMKVLVISDVHGRPSAVQNIIEKNTDADNIIFLGDGIDSVSHIEAFYPQKRFFSVLGNCDFRVGSDEDFITLAGKKVFLTHGHNYNVKTDRTLYSLKNRGRLLGADIVLFGHTHVPFASEEDGLYIMNPGAVIDSCYGIIEIEDGKIELKTHRF